MLIDFYNNFEMRNIGRTKKEDVSLWYAYKCNKYSHSDMKIFYVVKFRLEQCKV